MSIVPPWRYHHRQVIVKIKYCKSLADWSARHNYRTWNLFCLPKWRGLQRALDANVAGLTPIIFLTIDSFFDIRETSSPLRCT